MVVLALHPAVAEAAVQPAAQDVGPGNPLAGLVARLPCAAGVGLYDPGGFEVSTETRGSWAMVSDQTHCSALFQRSRVS
ncbi:MAG: hypothetical protein QOJ73_5777 [Streptosporangiaceae bacterium]|nr:hypothetical protein [Streptosporangiaceae bacterium]